MLSQFLIIRAETLGCQRFLVKMRLQMPDFSDYAKSVLSAKASFVHFYAAYRRTPPVYIRFWQKQKLTFTFDGSTIPKQKTTASSQGNGLPGDAAVFFIFEYFVR